MEGFVTSLESQVTNIIFVDFLNLMDICLSSREIFHQLLKSIG